MLAPRLDPISLCWLCRLPGSISETAAPRFSTPATAQISAFALPKHPKHLTGKPCNCLEPSRHSFRHLVLATCSRLTLNSTRDSACSCYSRLCKTSSQLQCLPGSSSPQREGKCSRSLPLALVSEKYCLPTLLPAFSTHYNTIPDRPTVP